MKIYIITGHSILLNSYGCAGVAITKELAEEKAQKEDIDSYIITEHEVISE